MGSSITDQVGSRERPGTNYPNQPERNPSSHLSDPLTYWWDVTLCPPELNDVSLAESVVILMRCAAIKEINLNTEVQKPSLAEVLEFQGPRMECADESTPHQETCIHSSILVPEPASRDKRPAQPYRLKKANKSDGQWSRWASDIRQSQPDQWSSSSSRWHSSAGDERSWNRVSEWEGSKWSTLTRGNLGRF